MDIGFKMIEDFKEDAEIAISSFDAMLNNPDICVFDQYYKDRLGEEMNRLLKNFKADVLHQVEEKTRDQKCRNYLKYKIVQFICDCMDDCEDFIEDMVVHGLKEALKDDDD